MGPGSAEQREERCTASGTRAECGLSAFLQTSSGATAFPGRSAARSGALLSRGPSRSVEIGPDSAEQREGRCTASGTRWPWRFLDSIFKQQRRYESVTPRRDTPELCIYLSPPWRATGEAKYFCKGGWTPLSTRRPT